MRHWNGKINNLLKTAIIETEHEQGCEDVEECIDEFLKIFIRDCDDYIEFINQSFTNKGFIRNVNNAQELTRYGYMDYIKHFEFIDGGKDSRFDDKFDITYTRNIMHGLFSERVSSLSSILLLMARVSYRDTKLGIHKTATNFSPHFRRDKLFSRLVEHATINIFSEKTQKFIKKIIRTRFNGDLIKVI